MKNMSILGTAIFVLGVASGWAQKAEPAPVLDLVEAVPFTLTQSYKHDWRQERPLVSSGYLVVLRVNPQDVQPRQTAEPVLYVGNQTAERINHGNESGFVIAIVPANVDPESDQFMNLKESLFWFGSAQLPEQVDGPTIEDQQNRARTYAIQPLPPGNVDRALAEGGGTLNLKDKRALLARSLELLRRYSPEDVDVINRLDLSVSAN